MLLLAASLDEAVFRYLAAQCASLNLALGGGLTWAYLRPDAAVRLLGSEGHRSRWVAWGAQGKHPVPFTPLHLLVGGAAALALPMSVLLPASLFVFLFGSPQWGALLLLLGLGYLVAGIAAVRGLKAASLSRAAA